jgi:hypothetical protein
MCDACPKSRDSRSRRFVTASCALALAAYGAECSFPDVTFGNDVSDASQTPYEGDASVQSGNGGNGADSAGSLSGSSGSSVGGGPFDTHGEASDGRDGTVGSNGSSSANGSNSGGGTSGGGSSGTSGSSAGGASGSGGSSGTSGSSASGGSSGTSGSSTSSSGGSGSSGGSASGSGGSSSGTTGPCTCGPSQMLTYPTNISCGTVVMLLGLGLGCSGPAEGFSDNGPPCGQVGTLTTCSAPLLNLNVVCVEGTGSTVTQRCQ